MMRINKPEYHDPLHFTGLNQDMFPEDTVRLYRIDFPDRVTEGIITARTQIALVRGAEASFSFDGIDAEVHTSSTYDERLRYPLHCEHGVGSPFVSASIEDPVAFIADNQWRLRKTGACVYELSILRERIVVPYYCPPDERHDWHARAREVLVVGDVDLEYMKEYSATH